MAVSEAGWSTRWPLIGAVLGAIVIASVATVAVVNRVAVVKRRSSRSRRAPNPAPLSVYATGLWTAQVCRPSGPTATVSPTPPLAPPATSSWSETGCADCYPHSLSTGPRPGSCTSLTPGREPTRNLPRTQTEPTRPASRAQFFISATTTTTAALTSDSTAQTALESGICPPFRNTASKSCPHHETNPSVDCRRCLEGRCVPGQQLSAIRHRSPSGFSTPANTFQTVNRLWRYVSG